MRLSSTSLEHYRAHLVHARQWRTREGLAHYYQFYWTPALGRERAAHWLREAASLRQRMLKGHHA
jgi:hypothetical protein